MEERQVWIYLAAVGLGLAAGVAMPHAGPMLEAALWPVLAALLTSSFAQVRFAELPAALRDVRFGGTVLVGNFVLVPVLVWMLLPIVPDDPAVQLGVLLVLLVPCTDWFITFAQVAGGDTRRAISATPLNFVAQIALLPVFLWLFVGEAFLAGLPLERFGLVFLVLIVLPASCAYLLERIAARSAKGRALAGGVRSLPVPLLALTIFMVAASQAPTVAAALPVFGAITPAFVLYLVGATLLGLALARALALRVEAARTLVFSLATRNSFVVLPFALALPPGWELAALVIVFQSLIELLGMLALVWLVPRALLRGR